MWTRPSAALVALLIGYGAAGPALSQTKPVCVRTCDGSFFPLQNVPQGRASPADMCKALCPATETILFQVPADGEITDAVSEKGKPYSALPNAGRYRTSYNPSCSCRKPGQSWADALKGAERLLKGRRGDLLVTEAKARELSLPPALRTAEAMRRKRKDPVARPSDLDPVATTGSLQPRSGYAQLNAEAPAGTAAKERPVRIIPH